ncbi:putative membrane protein YccC [Streptomyces sp. SAI-208]|uniref:FUSC family protein n=1 Tax=unclassified Streptomyces TaxID=2593676 RepID=UPI0024743F51|nr:MULTISPECIES: aromatic acid exporter family protein [unclassified Streptomyces]MDH6514678.1 putative membrane protein YccC [Streptomyces sp. SAI-090]MDH6546857.1 putative membrane protein YccC [Streptomyces sp. SAI-041]MDH6565970.1 putative membrane protein YccC [Streptomyces sp. SAI-117]MDH6589119.1 putative membrane protein YccC [Streptomyces sp. SAI-133]MDH6605525.1 putative membrane protein YccC [Streptomyces sp. SAI-208]
MRDVREWTASPVRFVKRRRDPVVVQTLRSAAAATIAYVIALRLSPEAAPLTAPLTALLVVQVTLYSTLTTGVRRVNSVVTGVLVAIAFSLLVGLTWWSLALLIVASLVVGRLVRVEEFVPEVAISAMLVLGVTTVGDTAWARVVETLIGAVVGLACNLLLAPPVWVDEAGESIEGLARRVRKLMLRMGEEAAGRTPVDVATARLYEARELDHDIVEVDAALRQAEDSLKLNPRVKEGLLHRVVLRTGLDTLEICTVVLRVLARTLTDLAKERDPFADDPFPIDEDQAPEPLFSPETGRTVEQLLSEIGDAVVSFAVLVTTHVSVSAESAEGRLTAELRQASATRDKLAQLLLEEIQRDTRHWQLHGAVLTEVNRILDELDTEHRSRRLLEELDRASREQRERMPHLTRMQERWRRNRPVLSRRSR